MKSIETVILQLSQSVSLNVKVLLETGLTAPPFFLISIVFQQQPFLYNLQIVHNIDNLYYIQT